MNKQTKRAFKDQLYEQFARISKAFANPHRLELLDILAQREWSVEALAQEAGLSVANASQHLQILRAAQLVEIRREGLHIYYRLADPRVFDAWRAMRDLAEVRLAEIERVVRTFLTDRQRLDAISIDSLLTRLRDGDVILLDVRPKEEYDAGYIPTARSIPLAELDQRLHELPPDREIVVYCRGPYCVLSDEAVSLLQQSGYQARRLDQGLPDWSAHGLPVERVDSQAEPVTL